MTPITIAALRRRAKRCRYADLLNRTGGVCAGVQIVVEGTALSSADGVDEVFGPKKEPGGVSMVGEMIVLRKERHLLAVIDGGVTSLEVGVN